MTKKNVRKRRHTSFYFYLLSPPDCYERQKRGGAIKKKSYEKHTHTRQLYNTFISFFFVCVPLKNKRKKVKDRHARVSAIHSRTIRVKRKKKKIVCVSIKLRRKGVNPKERDKAYKKKIELRVCVRACVCQGFVYSFTRALQWVCARFHFLP